MTMRVPACAFEFSTSAVESRIHNLWIELVTLTGVRPGRVVVKKSPVRTRLSTTDVDRIR
ncbi:hypothetical protein XHV734_2039 [Xanthomonas hortorum pv. vitians]|nr:hypothetical protein XHV734_2039 [Xanthomonas hortorum pv. vitians]